MVLLSPLVYGMILVGSWNDSLENKHGLIDHDGDVIKHINMVSVHPITTQIMAIVVPGN